MKAIWMTAGTTCRRARVLHDHSLGIVAVAQAIHATTSSRLAIDECIETLEKALTKCTQVPQAVIDCSDLSSVLRMADLSQEEWGSHLGKTVAESEDESTSNVH